MPRETLHFMRNHALVKKSGNSIIYQYTEPNPDTQEKEIRKKEYPIENIEMLELYGNIQITSQAMHLCASYNILIIIGDIYGNIRYVLFPFQKSTYGKIKTLQYKAYLNNEKRIKLIKNLLKSASENKIILLKRYKSKSEEILKSTERIKELIKKLEASKTIDKIRGYEASITKEYFSNFKYILNKYEFDHRTRQLPKNEINCLISFGNMRLYAKILNAIHKTGLCPFRGFLHEANFALAYDISEVFRQPIIDAMIFDLINNKRIGDNCFNKTKVSCMLNNLGKTIFLNKLENKMNSTFFHRKLKQHKSYRDCFRLETYKLIKFLVEGKEFGGFKIY